MTKNTSELITGTNVSPQPTARTATHSATTLGARELPTLDSHSADAKTSLPPPLSIYSGYLLKPPFNLLREKLVKVGLQKISEDSLLDGGQITAEFSDVKGDVSLLLDDAEL